MTDTRAKSLGWMAEVIAELVNELQATRKELEQEREKVFKCNHAWYHCHNCGIDFALPYPAPKMIRLACPACINKDKVQGVIT